MIDDFLVETGIARSQLLRRTAAGIIVTRDDNEYIPDRGRWTVESRISWEREHPNGQREGGSALEYTRLASKSQARRLIRALHAAGHHGRLLRHGRFRLRWFEHWSTSIPIRIRGSEAPTA